MSDHLNQYVQVWSDVQRIRKKKKLLGMDQFLSVFLSWTEGAEEGARPRTDEVTVKITREEVKIRFVRTLRLATQTLERHEIENVVQTGNVVTISFFHRVQYRFQLVSTDEAVRFRDLVEVLRRFEADSGNSSQGSSPMIASSDSSE